MWTYEVVSRPFDRFLYMDPYDELSFPSVVNLSTKYVNQVWHFIPKVLYKPNLIK